MSETNAPTAPKATRKGPRPSAETIRKRVALMIGSGNVDRLAQEGYVVVPASLLHELSLLASYLPQATPEGEANGE